MTGKIIIEAVPVPEEYEEQHNGQYNTSLHILMDLQQVSTGDRLAIAEALLTSLHFSPADMMKLRLLMADDKGLIHNHERVTVDLGALRREGGET